MRSELFHHTPSVSVGWRRLISEIRQALSAIFTYRGNPDHATRLLQGTPFAMCGEADFASFIELECRRAEQTGNLTRVLLISCIDGEGRIAPITPHLSSAILPLLARTLRGTDSIGWYRTGYVIGAALLITGSAVKTDEYQALSRRVLDRLRSDLPGDVQPTVHIRIYRPEELLPSN